MGIFSRILMRLARPAAGVEETCASVDEAPPARPAAAEVHLLEPAESRFHRIHPQTMALVAEMTSYAEFVAIMQRHLTNVCDETQVAAEGILGQALSIEGSISGLVGHVDSAMQSDEINEATEAMRASVDIGRAVIHELIDQQHRIQREVRETLEHVRGLSGQMTSRLEEIERIRRQTDLLAINARIHIAGIGKNTGLEVVADEIRVLSTQTGALAQNLREDLLRMDGHVSDDLIEGLAAQEAQGEARGRELQDSFEKLSTHIAILTQFQAALIGEVQSRGEAMRDPLNTLCGSIQFQDVARQQLEQVSRALSMISDHFVALSNAIIHEDTPPDSSIGSCLSGILENYVMEQQRAAHRGEALASAPRIELF